MTVTISEPYLLPNVFVVIFFLLDPFSIICKLLTKISRIKKTIVKVSLQTSLILY